MAVISIWNFQYPTYPPQITRFVSYVSNSTDTLSASIWLRSPSDSGRPFPLFPNIVISCVIFERSNYSCAPYNVYVSVKLILGCAIIIFIQVATCHNLHRRRRVDSSQYAKFRIPSTYPILFYRYEYTAHFQKELPLLSVRHIRLFNLEY